MSFLLFLSETMIPLLIFVIIGYGVLNQQPVYEEFISGAKKRIEDGDADHADIDRTYDGNRSFA